MENKTLNLIPYGDTELWYASGDDWSFPLHVMWRHDKENNKHYGLVMPAVCPYYSQGLKLISLLQVHDIQGRTDCWMIPRNMVEVILHKAPGVTTLYYYKWNEPDMPAIPIQSSVKINKAGDATTELVTHNFDLSNQDPFIAYLSEKSGLSKAVIKTVYKAICDNSARWMVEKREAIDFGVFKIFAAPFRPNWKEIIGCKFKRWKLLEMFTAPNGEKLEQLERAGVPGAMCSMHNVGVKCQSSQSKIYRISYTLETVPTKRFEKVVDEVERSRLACGGTSYVASFERTVETLYLHLLDALENYLHKTNYPFARLLESGSGGQLRFVPTESTKIKVRGIPIRHLPVAIIPPRSGFAITDGDRDSEVVPIPPPGMSEVPDLLQPNEDVRECKGDSDVDLDDRSTGNTGLPLLSSDQMQTEGQPVLSGRAPEVRNTPRLE